MLSRLKKMISRTQSQYTPLKSTADDNAASSNQLNFIIPADLKSKLEILNQKYSLKDEKLFKLLSGKDLGFKALRAELKQVDDLQFDELKGKILDSEEKKILKTYQHVILVNLEAMYSPKLDKLTEERLAEVEKLQTSTQLNFIIPADLKSKLEILNQKHSPKPKGKKLFKLPSGEGLDIEALHAEYKQVAELENKILDSQEKVLLKTYKLSIMQAIETQLSKLDEKKKNDEAKQKGEHIIVWGLRRLGFGILLLSGLFMDGVAAFLGVQELLGMIGFFSSTMSLAIGLTFCFINASLFYSF
ncbi:MAG TPA: hypothetical protein VHA13_05700, partial [Gammaproteobacteria bacterium]|nr:hypothetical protein [Gammaproteobacteria bacterium]